MCIGGVPGGVYEPWDAPEDDAGAAEGAEKPGAETGALDAVSDEPARDETT